MSEDEWHSEKFLHMEDRYINVLVTKRVQRRNIQSTSDTIAQKQMSSMQAVRMMSVNMAVRFHSLQFNLQKEGSLQLIMQHADNQQSRPAANLQQPSLPAADPQQLGPSRLPAPIPQQPSPFSGLSVMLMKMTTP